jgi:hypothetical protein
MRSVLTYWLAGNRQQLVWASSLLSLTLLAGVSVASANSPTPTKTCTPGSHPAPGCAYEGPTFTQTPKISPTITPTPIGPCASVPCGGTCAVCPPCTPGTVCPEAPCYLGTCEMVSGSCGCVPGISTPTPIPTVNQCDPSAHTCPVGTECNCCCGTWVCMPPYLPCCAITCAFPTPPPMPTPTPVPGECGSVCDGRPCTGFLIRSGTCQPDGDQCTCIPNTPAAGECALACDDRPCVGQCPDGSTASGFCAYLTIDTGCACALACSVPTPTPTPIPAALPCVGDCTGDGAVTVDEIVRLVNIALNGEPSPNTCPGSDQWCTSGPVVGAIGITCLIDAVNDALYGCPVTTSTPSCVPFPSLTPTFTFKLEPSAPRVGEHATLSVRITGGAHSPSTISSTDRVCSKCTVPRTRTWQVPRWISISTRRRREQRTWCLQCPTQSIC